MTEFWVAVAAAIVAAVLAILVPRLWQLARSFRHGGPMVTSLRHESLTLAGPEIFLVPHETRPGPGAPAPRQFGDLMKWQRSVGGVHLGWQSVRLTLRGLEQRPILVTKVKPVVLSREEPLDGWFIAPELGGGQAIRLFVSDLDTSDPVALLVPEGELQPDYAFRVTEEDVEYFELHVFTTRHFLTWGIDIEYEDSGRLGTLQIRDTRLQVTAETSASRPFTDGPDGKWIEAPWGEGFSAKSANHWRDKPVSSKTD